MTSQKTGLHVILQTLDAFF